ncbi:MAG: ABC transporter ATP-binding protein [Peptoniphilus sp.]|nr:ABC transporter ATP-binding protein [Peptoniphilus sp.]MDY3119054.1 ABC transporter ATP-binding protein [Peptoniphilus sp.]
MFVSLKNISKRMKGKVILEDVSLEMERGKIYGIYGVNGSGKTMFLRAVAGLMDVDSGAVFLDGEKRVYGTAPAINIGVMIEKVSFYGNLTGWENLRLLGEIRGPFDESEAKRLIAYFDMGHYINNKVRTYSLGMNQKLAIVQALMEKQPLVLLDEPTNALDEESVDRFYALLETVKREGRTVVLVSHKREDLRQWCDVCFRMREGRLYGEEK